MRRLLSRPLPPPPSAAEKGCAAVATSALRRLRRCASMLSRCCLSGKSSRVRAGGWAGGRLGSVCLSSMAKALLMPMKALCSDGVASTIVSSGMRKSRRSPPSDGPASRITSSASCSSIPTGVTRSGFTASRSVAAQRRVGKGCWISSVSGGAAAFAGFAMAWKTSSRSALLPPKVSLIAAAVLSPLPVLTSARTQNGFASPCPSRPPPAPDHR